MPDALTSCNGAAGAVISGRASCTNGDAVTMREHHLPVVTTHTVVLSHRLSITGSGTYRSFLETG